MSGTLYLVATPIGNLDDITLRAINVLKEVDFIAAEDTRHSLKLLNHLEISKPLISYHRHNEDIKTENLIEKLKDNKNIALITDAGTPGISDPGEKIVKQAIENNRFKCIQLQLSCFCCHSDRYVIANNIKCYLVHNFRNNRIYFSRHNRRTRFIFRNENFAKTISRA